MENATLIPRYYGFEIGVKTVSTAMTHHNTMLKFLCKYPPTLLGFEVCVAELTRVTRFGGTKQLHASFVSMFLARCEDVVWCIAR